MIVGSIYRYCRDGGHVVFNRMGPERPLEVDEKVICTQIIKTYTTIVTLDGWFTYIDTSDYPCFWEL